MAIVNPLDCFVVVLPEVSSVEVGRTWQCSLQGALLQVDWKKVGRHFVEDHSVLLVDLKY